MMADDARTEMREGFARVDEQFARVDGQFARVNEQFAGIDERLARIDERFDRVDAGITKSGDDSRRYFLTLTEQIQDLVKMVADGVAHNSSRLDNHEKRLKALEKPRRS